MTNDELRQEFEAWMISIGEGNSLAKAEFSGLYADNISLVRYEAYQACNAKRQEEMAQMVGEKYCLQKAYDVIEPLLNRHKERGDVKVEWILTAISGCSFEDKKLKEAMARDKALLQECYEALQCHIKSQQMLEKLKKKGYGNE